MRLLFGFADDFRGSSPPGKIALLQQEPPSTGDARFDAALAGTAEFFAREGQFPAPNWVEHPPSLRRAVVVCGKQAGIRGICAGPHSGRVRAPRGVHRAGGV